MTSQSTMAIANRTPSPPIIGAIIGENQVPNDVEGVGCLGGSGLRGLPGGTGGTRNPSSSSTCLPSGVTLSIFCDSTINCARNNGDSLPRKVSIETPMSPTSAFMFTLPS